MEDPPNFRRVPTNWRSCHFCIHMADNDGRFSCLAYECFVLLDSLRRLQEEADRRPADHLKAHAGGPSAPTCRGKLTGSPCVRRNARTGRQGKMIYLTGRDKNENMASSGRSTR